MLALCGCMVGPNFQKPKTSVPPSWSNPAPGAQRNDNASDTAISEEYQQALVEWWKSFNDPLLTSLMERAARSNPDIRLATSRIRQARAAREGIASALWPTLDSSASYRRSGSGGSSGGPAGTGSRDGGKGSADSAGGSGGSQSDLFQVGLDAAWELDIFGGTRRNVEASDADIRSAVEDRRDVLVSLMAEVGTNYVGLRGAQQQIEITRKNLETQKHTAGITLRRFEAGFVGRLDVANSYAQVTATESGIPLLESSAAGFIYNLGLLLGQHPAALAAELTPEGPIPTTPPEVPVGLPSELLRRRPDIRRAEAQAHAATARIGVATADLFPRISLTGDFGFVSSDITSLFNWNSRSWSLGPTVSWPVFNAGRTQSNIQVQNALQEQALITYEKTILTALKDVETALISYEKEQEQRTLLVQQVEYNRQAVDLSMQLYVAGQTDFLNVLSAQRALFTSEESVVQSSENLATDLIALYKALGGGWGEGESLLPEPERPASVQPVRESRRETPYRRVPSSPTR